MGRYASLPIDYSNRYMIQTFNPKHPWRITDNLLIPKLILFIIYPFGAWLYALVDPRSKSSYVIFFLFSLLLCWHMAPTGLTDYYDDFLGIMERFQTSFYTLQDITEDFHLFITFDDNAPKEIYEEFLIWLTKLFSDNYHYYFLLASIPVALCQLSVMRRITSDARFIPGIIGLIALAMLIFPRDIITVQNPRFSTGFWVCTFAAISYYCNPRRRIIYPLLILISPFFHSAMWLFVGIFFLSLVIPKKIRILEIVAICSIFFAFFNADILNGVNYSFMPSSMQMWVEQYLSEEAANQYINMAGRSGFWWVGATLDFFIMIMIFRMTLIMIQKRQYIEQNQEFNNLYPLYLTTFTITNIIQFVPVLGTRYFWFTRILCVFMWFKAFAFSPKYNRELWLLLGACSYRIILRYGYFMGGALATNTPPDIFAMPLPVLIYNVLSL